MIDVYASLATLLNHPLTPATVAPDSRDQLSTFLGKDNTGCDYVVQQNLNNTLSIIQGTWKYIEPSDKPATEHWTKMELGNNPKPQTVQYFHRSIGKRQCCSSASGDCKSSLSTTGASESR